MENTFFFDPKSWWKYNISWFPDDLIILVLFFLGVGNRVFFWEKKLLARWYLLVTEKFLFWTFRWWEIRSFFRQKIDVKIIFTWYFWAFHDISGPGKYGFSCSDFSADYDAITVDNILDLHKYLMKKTTMI